MCNLPFQSQRDKLVNIKTYRKGDLLIESDTPIDQNIEYIPNIFTGEINAILNKMKLHGVKRKCINNSYCHKTRDHVKGNGGNEAVTFTYPLYNTSANPYSYFSSKPHPDQYKSKVIMSCSGKLNPIYDRGIYGVTQDSMYILVDNDRDGELLVDTLKSKLYSYIIKICQWGNFRNEPKLFSSLYFPRFTNTNSAVDDKWVWDYFQLTLDEINFINHYA